jgi:hypothetical protein
MLRGLVKRSFAVRCHFLLLISILMPTRVSHSTTLGNALAQTAQALSQVKKVYVASLGGASKGLHSYEIA